MLQGLSASYWWDLCVWVKFGAKHRGQAGGVGDSGLWYQLLEWVKSQYQGLEQVGVFNLQSLRQEWCVPQKWAVGELAWVRQLRGSVLAAGAELLVTAHVPGASCWMSSTCMFPKPSECEGHVCIHQQTSKWTRQPGGLVSVGCL